MPDTQKTDTLATAVLTVGALMGARLFQPASIQRDFNWEEENCRSLFEDIYRIFSSQEASSFSTEDDLEDIEPGEDDDDALLSGVAPEIDTPIPDPPDTYLLGPMYLSPPRDGMSEIFDGLQRMTSMTLLLSVLRDRLQARNPAWAEWLEGFIRHPERGLRLTYPTGSHKDTGTARFLEEFAQTPGETLRTRHRIDSRNPRGRVGRGVRVFRDLTEDMGQQELAAFAQFLLNRVQLIVVEIADARLAHQAFVTSNQRGVPLQPVDILKGRLMDIAGNEDAGLQVKESWDRVRQTPDLAGFMSAVDFIERRKQQGPAHLIELGDYLANARPGFAIIEWVERLEKLAQGWRIMKTALADPRRDPFGGDLWRLGLLNWTEWKPLALHFVHVFEEASRENDARRKTTVRNRFDLFHRRAIAMTLAGLNARARHAIIRRAVEQSEGLLGNGRTTNCMSLTGGAMRLKPSQKEKALRQLKNGFEDREARAAFIQWLESLHWTPEALQSYLAAGTVEHILPQTPAQDAVQWFEDFPDASERIGLCNMLGNLILIDRDTNAQAGSQDFSAKVQLYRMISPPFAMASEVAAQERWRRDDILARSDRMRGFAIDGLKWEK